MGQGGVLHIVQEDHAVHGVEPVELHALGGAVGLQAVDEGLDIGQILPGGDAVGEEHVGGLEVGGGEHGVVGGSEALPQLRPGDPGHHGGGLRPGEGLVGGKGAPVVHAGEDAGVVEGQHGGVGGVGQGGDLVDGGQHILGHHGGKHGDELLAGGLLDGIGHLHPQFFQIVHIGGVPGQGGIHQVNGVAGDGLVHAGGDGGHLAHGKHLVGGKAGAGAGHEAHLIAGLDGGGVPGRAGHIGKAGIGVDGGEGLLRRDGGGGACQQGGGESQGDELLFHGTFPPVRRVFPI